MMFSSPAVFFLLLLLLLPLVAWRMVTVGRRRSIPFSGTDALADLSPSWRQRLRWLPAALRVAVLALLIIALARPQEGRKETVTDAEGIAIEMVVDRSGSMLAMDFDLDGSAVDRLTAIKSVASQFIEGGDGLEGRFSDLIGLITFAGRADGVSPPTLDHAFVVSQLQQTEIVTSRSEDGTAIGDALGLAVEKLASLKASDGQEVESKVVILLTDGENNAGELDPVQAAELARTLGIKVYTIGVGTTGSAPVPVVDPFSGRRVLRYMQVSIDEATLRSVAEMTGGRYFRATDTDSLAAIYREIDELEKTRVEAKQYVDYREMAIEPTRLGALTVPPIVLAALLLLALQILLSSTVLRRLE